MRKKLAPVLAAVAGAVGLLVPMASSAAAACVVVNGPNRVRIQVGYAPKGPHDCRQLPPPRAKGKPVLEPSR